MYSYEWDKVTGGIVLGNSALNFSKEPRPVYYKELDILGFDKYWEYEKKEEYPIMWAESNTYWYRGKRVARLKGGSMCQKPEIEILDKPEPDGVKLKFVDIEGMIKKNAPIMESLVQETIKKVYNAYVEYKDKVDLFYVAFSGGKDSVVALDIVQRALPHSEFKVLFGDTGMEFPDTYDNVSKVSEWCKNNGIDFLTAKSELNADTSWKLFGPPAVTNRWCCSVHKTAPQIKLLKKITGIKNFTGMAFTGVRGDESPARKEYDDISYGGKHQGQYSCHAILNWNSAELYIYIYQRKLFLNSAYKKGNSRAGCLVCPMSSGKHEYFKDTCYRESANKLVKKIEETSGKTSFSKDEMKKFIENGNWKTRKSGRELNFGYDKHLIDTTSGTTTITIFSKNNTWKEWTKTIGNLLEYSKNNYTLDFQDKTYEIKLNETNNGIEFNFPNLNNSRQDIKFLSLFKSCIIKSVYCVSCGVCVAECPYGCIDMTSETLKISGCKHCYKCHDIPEHCLRYNSIRNRIGVETKMKGLGNYYTFGIREEWLNTFLDYEGKAEFWDTDGNYMLGKKMKDAFLNFVKNAGIVERNKDIGHDKYTKYELTSFGKKIVSLYQEDKKNLLWALILCNLTYTPDFNWFIKNVPFNEVVTQDWMKLQLETVMEDDVKGLGKRNVVSAFKNFLIKTPFGTELGLGKCDYDEKTTSAGVETITLKSFIRVPWDNPDLRILLYSLYKFAENCDDYYSFTLSRIMNHDVDSLGVSPTEIFGIDRDTMEKLLNAMGVNYPDFISVSFTHDLDNITLYAEKKSEDILKLF